MAAPRETVYKHSYAEVENFVKEQGVETSLHLRYNRHVEFLDSYWATVCVLLFYVAR
jgi:hypothetical protein